MHSQSTVSYNLDDTAQPITVGFAPLSIPLVAHFVGWNETNFWTESKPVLGALIQHTVNGAGEVTGDRLNLAIQLEDTGELCTTMEYAQYSGAIALVAVLPLGEEPSTEENQRIATLHYQLDQASAARRKAVA